MTKQSKPAPQRQAPKTPVTKEAVRRVQSRTAVDNGGQQKDWTRRLQSTADKRAAQSAAHAKPAPSRPGEEQHRKGAAEKKFAR